METKPREFDAKLIESGGGNKVEVVTYRPEYVETGEKTGWRRYGGIIFTAASSVFFSLTILTVKLLDHYHPLTISVWRFLGILIPPIPLAFYYQCKTEKDDIFKAVWPLKGRENMVNFICVQARGIITVAMVLLRFWALKYLDVADLAVIAYTGPVFVMILAYFFLDEKCGIIPILVAILTCLGVFIIIRPPLFTGADAFDTNTLIGVAFALGSTVCNSFVVILVRRIRKVHFTYTLLIGGIWGVGECLIIAAAFGVLQFPEGTKDLILAFGLLPVFAFLANFLIIIALKFESAGPVSLIRACDVVFAFIWQFIFLSKYPDLFSFTGGAIIVIGVAVLTIRKWLSTLPPDDERRTKFQFLLR